jgi:gluconokinase/xylulokinase
VSEPVYLGLDLGTSGLKALAIGAAGDVVARAEASYPTRRPAPGAAEQQPADWVDAVVRCVRELTAGRDLEVRGIGLAAMLPTLVTVDGDGQAIGPALSWEDARAEPDGERLRQAAGPEHVYATTGQWLDGRYLLPMFLRLVATDPERAEATAAIRSAKDHLFGWLTGSALTDPSTAAGTGCYALATGAWDGAITAAAADLRRGPLPALPEVADPGSTAGLVSDAASALGLRAGTPVGLGAADSVLGALGVGARDPGDVAYVAGTSTVILGITDRLVMDASHRYLVTPMASPGRWGYEMDLLSTGSAVRWLAGLLGAPDEAAVMTLAAGAAAEDSPVFLPYLAPGEQGALWDPTLRGALAGLDLGHGPSHIARSMVTGLVLESRRCLAVLSDAGLAGEVRMAGWSARDPMFRQDLADATGRNVVVGAAAEADSSALGAATLVAAAVDRVELPAAGVDRHRPAPGRRALWSDLAERHDRVLRTTTATG